MLLKFAKSDAEQNMLRHAVSVRLGCIVACHQRNRCLQECWPGCSPSVVERFVPHVDLQMCEFYRRSLVGKSLRVKICSCLSLQTTNSCAYLLLAALPLHAPSLSDPNTCAADSLLSLGTRQDLGSPDRAVIVQMVHSASHGTITCNLHRCCAGASLTYRISPHQYRRQRF